MPSQSMSNPQHAFGAFTTIEILLVLVIIGIISTLSYASLVNYHTTTVIDSELKTIVSNIQVARQKAIGNPTGSVYSIKFLSGSYVVFPGSTYSASNTSNQIYNLDNTVIVSTTFPSDLVTFNTFTGRVTNGGSITISGGGFTKHIIINLLGIVEDIT